MPLTWRDDASLSAAGSIADVGSHAYDTVRWILDENATKVLTHAETITPGKADLGEVNLTEALEWGGAPEKENRPTANVRKGGTFDYASIAWRFESEAVGTLILSHATFLRKGLAPELELHGTEASLGIDRITGNLMLFRPDQSSEMVATVPDKGFGNRFEKYVFPVVRAFMDGTREVPVYPSLKDGLAVQLFTDAALASAKSGGWVDVASTQINSPLLGAYL